MYPRAHSLVCLIAFGSLTLPVCAAVKYSDGEKYIKLGGQIQLQYHYEKPDVGASTDDIFFRRLKLTVEGSAHKDWKGKIQLDFGKAENDNEVAVKDAYFRYLGMKNMLLTIGNMNFPFSRELLTSSKTQQLVERTFVGDHNYGTPDKNVGVHLRSDTGNRKVTWAASGSVASIDPDNKKLDFDTPVNRNDDFNDGFMLGGRVDFFPFGFFKFSQGDFTRETRVAIGVAAYTWSNDDDNNASPPVVGKADVDSVTGVEISAACRGAGFSIDAEYNSFDSETVEAGITDGIYKKGKTTLTNAAIEGGYMFGQTLELVAGYQTQDADGYTTAWNRTSVGANWYINKQDIKVQLTYRMGENKDGEQNNDIDEVFVQTQFLF